MIHIYHAKLCLQFADLLLTFAYIILEKYLGAMRRTRYNKSRSVVNMGPYPQFTTKIILNKTNKFFLYLHLASFLLAVRRKSLISCICLGYKVKEREMVIICVVHTLIKHKSIWGIKQFLWNHYFTCATCSCTKKCLFFFTLWYTSSGETRM